MAKQLRAVRLRKSVQGVVDAGDQAMMALDKGIAAIRAGKRPSRKEWDKAISKMGRAIDRLGKDLDG